MKFPFDDTGVLLVVCFLGTVVVGDVVKYFTLKDRSRLIEMVRNDGKVTDCAVLADRDEIIDILKDIPRNHIHELGNKDIDIKIKSCHDLQKTLTHSQLRKKRWTAIYPGTKWCGKGNVSNHYEDLGQHRETDTCCREHDFCPDWILPLETKYGLKNWALYVKFPCWCDDKLYKCLKKSTDEAASTVGRLFFNFFRIKCYKDVHPRTCVKKNWWNTCMKYTTDKTKTVKQFVSNKWF